MCDRVLCKRNSSWPAGSDSSEEEEVGRQMGAESVSGLGPVRQKLLQARQPSWSFAHCNFTKCIFRLEPSPCPERARQAKVAPCGGTAGDPFKRDQSGLIVRRNNNNSGGGDRKSERLRIQDEFHRRAVLQTLRFSLQAAERLNTSSRDQPAAAV
ncbi:unnamed protein product [Lampetra fluviatilis]